MEECFDEPHLAIYCGGSDDGIPSLYDETRIVYAIEASFVEDGGSLVLMKSGVVGQCWK